MTSLPFASPANVADLRACGALGAAMLLSDVAVLLLAHRAVVNEPRLLASMVLFAVQVGLAVVGSRAVRATAARYGDTARPRIQAQAFRAANSAAQGAAFLLMPLGTGWVPVVVGGAGVLMLLVAFVIVVGALTPRAVRSRLEGEADRQIASAQ